MPVWVLLLTDDIAPFDPGACAAPLHAPHATGTLRRSSLWVMESRCWLVALPAVDGRQYVYRVYAPENALPADLFWEAWHCHDEGPFPRAWDLFDAAVIQRMG